jgi:hypothetical protein
MFNRVVLSTFAIVSLFFLTMLYKDGHCCWKLIFPNHLSSQNLIWFPLFKWNETKSEKIWLAIHQAGPKLWKTQFLLSFDYCLFCEIFLSYDCLPQCPSSLIKLNNNLLSKHWFWISTLFIPNPPWFFGWHIILHFVSIYFFLWLSFFQKHCDLW